MQTILVVLLDVLVESVEMADFMLTMDTQVIGGHQAQAHQLEPGSEA